VFAVFFATALSICVAEIGDKTQLLVMGLSAKYRLRDIAIGVISAAVLLNALGVLLGSALSALVPMEYVSLAAGLFFLIFALLTLKPDECGEEEVKIKKTRMPAALSIGTAFFLAELGDKTQLTAIAFSANNTGSELAVFLGATTGLIIWDALGAACGLLLHKSLPECVIKYIACGIFTFFGFVTVYPALKSIMGVRSAIIATAVLAAVYAVFLLIFLSRCRKARK
jgi:putative Ca2+/H+ antiporter (TMEM165/GDT1 family)